MIHALDIRIQNKDQVKLILKGLASDKRIYSDMLLGAWMVAADRAFRSGGFGLWAPLSPKTIEMRKRRSGSHYKKKPDTSASASFPPNTWTGLLRQSVLGTKQRVIRPERLSKSIRTRIRTRLSYAEAALKRRPIDGAVLNRITQIMAGIIQPEIQKNIQILINKNP